MSRLCQIVEGSIEDASGNGDMAYDLSDAVGTPDQIAQAIAHTLKTTDLFVGRELSSLLDAKQDLFLSVRIKFCKPSN